MGRGSVAAQARQALWSLSAGVVLLRVGVVLLGLSIVTRVMFAASLSHARSQ